MRVHKVNKTDHTVFESVDEVPSSILYREVWRDGHLSDWVLADDGCIIQILREGTMLKSRGSTRKYRYLYRDVYS